jgi:DNA-binding response OmpR family regulator
MVHILVADDDSSIRHVVGEVLEEAGYRVFYAHSGRTTLKQLEAQRIDLVILDMRMPDGDGRQTFSTMQSQPHLCSVPVIIITTGELGMRMDGDVGSVLLKPFDLDHLLHLVLDTVGPAEALSTG